MSASDADTPAPPCANCHREQPKEQPRFKRCTKCVAEKLVEAVYCCKQCQKEDWPAHKRWHEGMRALLAEAAPADAAPAKTGADSDPYDALVKEGLRECATGAATGGIATFREAIALQPEQPVAYANLGYALRNTGDFAGAVPALLKAMDLYEDDTEPWATMAAVAWFSRSAFAGGETETPAPAWMTSVAMRISIAERCAAAAPSVMQVWAMLGMALAEEDADLGRAAQAMMRAAKLTEQRETKEGYLTFAKALLQRLKAGTQHHQQADSQVHG